MYSFNRFEKSTVPPGYDIEQLKRDQEICILKKKIQICEKKINEWFQNEGWKKYWEYLQFEFAKSLVIPIEKPEHCKYEQTDKSITAYCENAKCMRSQNITQENGIIKFKMESSISPIKLRCIKCQEEYYTEKQPNSVLDDFYTHYEKCMGLQKPTINKKQCQVCKKEFKTIKSKNTHYSLYCKYKRFDCKLLNKYKKHYTYDFECFNCHYKTRYEKDLDTHECEPTGKFKCQYCNKMLKSYIQVKRHEYKMHLKCKKNVK